jgi:Stage II sporulation protein E (SpoIIE)
VTGGVEILTHLSFRHREHGNFGLFFTAALARIDMGGRRMFFAGGGHPPAGNNLAKISN